MLSAKVPNPVNSKYVRPITKYHVQVCSHPRCCTNTGQVKNKHTHSSPRLWPSIFTEGHIQIHVGDPDLGVIYKFGGQVQSLVLRSSVRDNVNSKVQGKSRS